jgi:hypothetical protein
MGCWQCLPLGVVQLKAKHCQKPHCRNEVVDRFGQAGLEKNASLLAYLPSIIYEQGVIFRLLHEKLQAGWKENLKERSEHPLF